MEEVARKRYGAVPSQTLRELLSAGFLKGGKAEQVSPASFDLTVSDECYCVRGMPQLHRGETIEKLLSGTPHERHDLSKPLERDQVYIVRFNESVELPENVYGYTSPKSSTGRIDVHVRMLADGVPRYDSLAPAGYKGNLWVSIVPKSFSVKLSVGEAISQLRLFTADTRFDELDLQIALRDQKLVWNPESKRPLEYDELPLSEKDGSVTLSIDLSPKIAGWKAKSTVAVLDMSARGTIDAQEFFEPVQVENGSVKLERGAFYILSSYEAVRVPPALACEMAPMDERAGDFRTHYAGFIDPGWGWGKMGEGFGRQLTHEVRPFEDLLVRDRQPIGKIRFERLSATPDIFYDTKAVANYVDQHGPRLSKHFAQ